MNNEKPNRLLIFNLYLITGIMLLVTFFGCGQNSQQIDRFIFITPSPANNATGVAVDAKITAVFSKDIDPSTITTATFTLAAGTSAVTGVASYDGASKTATFTPAGNLSYATTYEVTIAGSVKDTAGAEIGVAYTWSFTTVATGGAITPPSPTYTVTYDGNGNSGGTVPADSSHYLAGETVTVLGNTGGLVKTGYTFAGWNTAAAGTGTTMAGSSTFAMGSADVTLYAIWTLLPTYTVTYDGNGNSGGIVPADSNHYLAGETVTVLGNTGALVKTGYTFAGWNTAADGTGTTMYGSLQFAMGSADVTLYAMWTLIPTYAVTYDGTGSTGGSVPIDSNTYTTGTSVTILGNTGNLVAIRGSTFEGWSTEPSGEGTTYTAGQTFIMGSANVTLYANWKPIYALGSSGEAGIVFYDRGSYTSGLSPDWRYMEYATVDQGTQEVWWNITTVVDLPMDGTIGAGKTNTDAIIAISLASAAGLCRAYNGGGKTDWFMPSYDEFGQISFVSSTRSPEYQIVSPGVYWTSTYWGWDGNNKARTNGDSFEPHWDWTDQKHLVRAAREF